MLSRRRPPGPVDRRRLSESQSAATGTGDWSASTVSVRKRPYTVWTRPGVSDVGGGDVSTSLLVENIETADDRTVVVLNCGSGLAGAVAATDTPDARVMLASPSLVDCHAARRTVGFHQLTSCDVRHRGRAEAICPPGTAEVVAAVVPKGRIPTLQLIWVAYQALAPGGRFWLAGANDDGIQSALDRVAELFGDAAVLQYRKGCRIGLATRRPQSGALPPAFAEAWLRADEFTRYSATIATETIEVRSRPGVFSWDRLDPGTAALIDAMQVSPGDRVLDLGCGSGLVGVVASRKSAGPTVFVDSDADAIASARETTMANRVENAQVIPSDGVTEIEHLRFDVVATNPPFHIGQHTNVAVAKQFIEGARRVLTRGGRFYLVANSFLPYEGPLAEAFDQVQTVYDNRKYKVLCGRQNRGRSDRREQS
jgi:16S rRNA (guanine1207-N2)-methyltransferase